MPRGYLGGGGLVPIPDPSKLTTDQLRQEVKGLRELIEAKLEGMTGTTQSLRELVFAEIGEIHKIRAERAAHVDTLFVAHEKAIATALIAQQQAAKDNIDITRSEIDKLAAVSAERFTRIDTQFIERDKRTDQLSLADKTAVAAALQAAKEAVGAQNTSNSIAIAKSESSTVESIRQLQTLFNSAIDGLNDKVNDVKSRLDRGEGGNSATREVRKEGRDNNGLIVGAAGMVIALAAFIFALVKG